MVQLRLLIAASALLIAACAADAAGVRAGGPRLSDGDSFRMRPGTSVSLPGEGRLHYLQVANDSRCKPGVQCIWAGDAEVAFEWRPDTGSTEAFSLHTGKGAKQHTIGKHLLLLTDLGRGPAPEATLQLQASRPAATRTTRRRAVASGRGTRLRHGSTGARVRRYALAAGYGVIGQLRFDGDIQIAGN